MSTDSTGCRGAESSVHMTTLLCAAQMPCPHAHSTLHHVLSQEPVRPHLLEPATMACSADFRRALCRADASTAAAMSRRASTDSCGSCADTPAAVPASTLAAAAACCACRALPSLAAIRDSSTCRQHRITSHTTHTIRLCRRLCVLNSTEQLHAVNMHSLECATACKLLSQTTGWSDIHRW